MDTKVAPKRILSLEQIQAILDERRDQIKREYGVTGIGVFGSYVRNEARLDSDIDILVEFEKTPGFFKFLELEEKLSEWLGIPVDLTTRNALKPRIGRHILKEVVMI